jgi:hypothetical protein
MLSPRRCSSFKSNPMKQDSARRYKQSIQPWVSFGKELEPFGSVLGRQ